MEACDRICPVQVSAFLAGLFLSRLIKRVLIVAPKTLHAHWTKELSVVGLKHKIREYRTLYLLSHMIKVLLVGANHLFLPNLAATLAPAQVFAIMSFSMPSR